MKTLRRLATALLGLIVVIGVMGCVAWMTDEGAMAGMDMSAMAHAMHTDGQLVTHEHTPPPCESCEVTEQNVHLPMLFSLSTFGAELPIALVAFLHIVVFVAVATISARAPPHWRARPDLVIRLRQHRAVVMLS